MPIYQVGGTQPVRLVTRGDPPSLIINRDLSNSIIIGNGPEIFGDNTNEVDMIDALGSMAVTGDEDIWASTLTSAPVAVSVKSNATNWSASPAQIAAQIAVSGVFSLTKSTPLAPAIPGSMLALATYTSPAMPITQTAYEIAFAFQVPSNAVGPFAAVEMVWSDSNAGGQVCGHERWNVALGSAPSSMRYIGAGPTKGDTLTVIITSFCQSILTIPYFTIVQNSRVWQRDDWRVDVMDSVPTFTSATYDIPSLTLCSTAPTIGAGSSVNRILPLFSGQVQYSFVPGIGSGTGLRFVINNEADQTGLTAKTVWQNNDGTSAVFGQFFMPRSTCSVSIFNDGTASASPSLNLTIADTQSGYN